MRTMERVLTVLLVLVAAVGSAWGREARATAAALESGAYRDDSTLTRVVIPAEIERIPDMAFAFCRELEAVEFEGGSRLKEIGENAFYECVNLRRLSVPAGVRSVPRGMCAWCEGLEGVDLPEGLREIGAQAFAYCGRLVEIRIPEGVRRVGSNAFSRCGRLEEVELPDAVRELESYAFSDCVSLRGAKLPANGCLLGELIFSGCESLEEIREMSREVPKFDCNSFIFEPDEGERYERCRLKVAKGMKEKYAQGAGWCLFKRIEEE